MKRSRAARPERRKLALAEIERISHTLEKLPGWMDAIERLDAFLDQQSADPGASTRPSPTGSEARAAAEIDLVRHAALDLAVRCIERCDADQILDLAREFEAYLVPVDSLERSPAD